jgi:hypothetical protein
MKRQYLGDVNDYRKYCLLRHFADEGRIRIGVCWMLTPDDHGPDGRKTAYLTQPEQWRSHDPPLFDMLHGLVLGNDQRLLSHIERCGIIPDATFFKEEIPDSAEARKDYMSRALETLKKKDLIFFDPDNGIEPKAKVRGRKNLRKYLYWHEIAKAFRAGHSLLIYQHFIFEERRIFISRLLERLRSETGAEVVRAVPTPHVVFFLVTSDPKITALAECIPGRFGMRVERGL